VDARGPASIGQIFANPSWFLKPAESWIFVTAYRSMRIAAADLPRPVVRDLGRLVRCAFFHGTMTYLDGAAARLTPVTADNWRVDLSGVVERQTEVGPLTVIATPSRIDGADVVEQTYRERTQTAVGLLLAWEGRNIVHGPLFEMNVAVTSNQVTAVSPTLDNPLTFPAPNLSSARLTALEGAARAVETLASDVRARVELSLRWYEPGMYSSGIDSFLRLWIAIETLCMPSTTERSAPHRAAGSRVLVNRARREDPISDRAGIRSARPDRPQGQSKSGSCASAGLRGCHLRRRSRGDLGSAFDERGGPRHGTAWI
jgi:hypothetical protein